MTRRYRKKKELSENMKWKLDMLLELVTKEPQPIDSHRVAREFLVGPKTARMYMNTLQRQRRARVFMSSRLYICAKSTHLKTTTIRDERRDGKRYIRHDVLDLLKHGPMRLIDIVEALLEHSRAGITSAIRQLKERGEIRPIENRYYEMTTKAVAA